MECLITADRDHKQFSLIIIIIKTLAVGTARTSLDHACRTSLDHARGEGQKYMIYA